MRPPARLMLLVTVLSLSACTTLRPAPTPIELWHHLPPTVYGDD